MAQNFLACDREQELLLPPSLREWLPEDHLAWFVIDTVAEMDLAAFYASYRADGHGRAAHDPAMMVTLLLYVYAIGERSSRRIERRCTEDVATRVICANQRPDHTTVARFRQRHEAALASLFGEVLALCVEAGLVRVGVVAIDGTKVHANAWQHAIRKSAALRAKARNASLLPLDRNQAAQRVGREIGIAAAGQDVARRWRRPLGAAPIEGAGGPERRRDDRGSLGTCSRSREHDSVTTGARGGLDGTRDVPTFRARWAARSAASVLRGAL
jgi:transposase